MLRKSSIPVKKSSISSLEKKLSNTHLSSETSKPSLKHQSSTTSLKSTKSTHSKTTPDLTIQPAIPKKSKVSDRLNPKTVPPLGYSKCKTAFSAAYTKGAIPCRLVHGSVHHTLSWIEDPIHLSYNPLLVTFFEGLIETQHPYTFLVREGIKEMLSSDGAYDKVLSVLRSLIKPLREGLCSKEKSVLLVSLSTLKQLTTVVGPRIIPFLGTLLPPLASKVHHTEFGNEVMETLRHMEMIIAEGQFENAQQVYLDQPPQNLAHLILRIIKTKVPTYTSVYF